MIRAFGLEDLVCSLLGCLDDQRCQFGRAHFLGSGSEEAALEDLDLVLKAQADLLEVLDLGGGFKDFGFYLPELFSSLACFGFGLESPIVGLGQGDEVSGYRHGCRLHEGR